MTKRWRLSIGAIGVGLLLPAASFVVATTAKEKTGGEISPRADKPAPLSKNTVSTSTLKVYVDENRTVYWPMGLPFYVRLAAAPEDGQESFLLQKLEVKSLTEAKQSINEGVRLEIPGAQFIRWMNHLSKDELMYRFIADGSPPVTSLKFMQASRYEGKKSVYYGKGLIAELIAKDEHSGVREAYVSMDKAPFTPYKQAMHLDQERSYRLEHYAVDKVGYLSAVESTELMVDLTAPHSSVSVKNNFKDTVLSSSSRLFLASNDNLSGVKSIFYKFNNQAEYQKYPGEQGISTTGLSDGTQILKFYAEDEVANREQPQEFQFYLDLAAPTVAFTFSTDSFVDGAKSYISPRTRVKFDASDGQVKVKEILYAVNDAAMQSYSTPFTPAVNQGKLLLQYSARDELNNLSQVKKSEITMDSEPPHSSHTIKGRSFVKEAGIIYLGPGAKIVLSADDNLAGVRHIEYQISEAPSVIYSEAISLPQEGRFLFRYWATDRVNNQESYAPLLFISDTTAPEIVETFSNEPLRLALDKSPAKNMTYYVNTSLSLGARDSSAGVSKIEYALNGDKWQLYTNHLQFPNKGSYIVKVRSTDQVGNRSEKVISFDIVDKT
ncbi:MAG: hypothetical protein NTX25_03065 [Proteobacteria bacterium]|nr:hypothetical protein [Pseudomonadota bacterium]